MSDRRVRLFSGSGFALLIFVVTRSMLFSADHEEQQAAGLPNLALPTPSPAQPVIFSEPRVDGRHAEPLPFVGYIVDVELLAAVAISVIDCSEKNLSSSTDFEVNECSQPASMEYCTISPLTCHMTAHVVLRVRQRGEVVSEARSVSRDRHTELWMKEVAGPLNIYAVATLDGQWIVTGYSVYRPTLGDYIVFFPAPFKLAPVQLRLRLKIVQRDFDGIDEIAPTTRRTSSQYVVPKDATAMFRHPQLSSVRLNLRRSSFLYGWKINGSADQKWDKLRGGRMRYECMTSNVPLTDVSCMKGLSVVITGDSQSRSLFWALRDALLAANVSSEGRASYDESGAKIKRAEIVGQGVRARYIWDNYLENISSSIAGADVIVLGMGAHAASWGQWTVKRFTSEMNRVAQIVCSDRSLARRVIWYGAPAWPKHKTAANFRATNLRLGVFNGIGQDVLTRTCTQHTLRLVDFFHQTYSVLHLSKDGAHFDKSVIAPTMAHSIALAACSK